MSSEMVVLFVFSYHFSVIFCHPIITEDNGEKEMTDNPIFIDIMEQNVIGSENQQHSVSHHNNKGRVKRSNGGDKFSNAATMTETKMFQMYLQLFKNVFASSYIGGGHPLHPDVPKPVLLLFKERVLSFFFPPVGDEDKKM